MSPGNNSSSNNNIINNNNSSNSFNVNTKCHLAAALFWSVSNPTKIFVFLSLSVKIAESLSYFFLSANNVGKQKRLNTTTTLCHVSPWLHTLLKSSAANPFNFLSFFVLFLPVSQQLISVWCWDKMVLPATKWKGERDQSRAKDLNQHFSSIFLKLRFSQLEDRIRKRERRERERHIETER